MKKPEPKYALTGTFSVEKDGFYGLYYEPKVNRFPGKGMVICTGSDGSNREKVCASYVPKFPETAKAGHGCGRIRWSS